MNTHDDGVINLDMVERILKAASKNAKRLNGLPFTDMTARKSAEAASRNRDLNQLAESLELAAGLIHHELWVARGYPDYLEDTDD